MISYLSHLTSSTMPERYQLATQSQRGFTLLEMVLVLFLIGLLASAGLLFTEGVEDQAKYDETKRRMELIRKAIIGDPTRTINGAPEISGFAADMGRLPECLAELMFQRNCEDDEDLPDWNYDANSGIWLGWRGPYLNNLQDNDGITRFRDGYGNVDPDPVQDDQNYGWEYAVDSVAGQVTLGSVGFDIYAPEDDITSELVSFNDFIVTLGQEWKKIPVVFSDLSTDSNATSIPANALRIRINHPVNGLLPNWADDPLDSEDKRDFSSFLSERFPFFATTLASGRVKFEFQDGVSKKILFSTEVMKSGDEITVPPGTLITYQEQLPPGEVLYQFQVSPFCKSDCKFEINGVVENIDGDYSELTTDAASTSFLEAPSALLMILVDKLAKAKLIVPVGSSISTDILTLPNGATVSLPSDSSDIFNNQVVLGGSEITVSEAFTIDNNIVTTALTGDSFAIPPGTVRGLGNDLSVPAALSLPMGQRSLTVVCENNGEVFNGDCSSSDGSENRSFITLIPRSFIPNPPAPLIWSIK